MPRSAFIVILSFRYKYTSQDSTCWMGVQGTGKGAKTLLDIHAAPLLPSPNRTCLHGSFPPQSGAIMRHPERTIRAGNTRSENYLRNFGQDHKIRRSVEFSERFSNHISKIHGVLPLPYRWLRARRELNVCECWCVSKWRPEGERDAIRQPRPKASQNRQWALASRVFTSAPPTFRRHLYIPS